MSLYFGVKLSCVDVGLRLLLFRSVCITERNVRLGSVIIWPGRVVRSITLWFFLWFRLRLLLSMFLESLLIRKILDFLCFRRSCLNVWTGSLTCYVRVITEGSDKRIFFDLWVAFFLLGKTDVAKVVFHFILFQGSYTILLPFFLNFPFLDDRFSIIDSLYDLISILYFDMFLHHFPEQIILHFPDNTFLLNNIQIMSQFIFLTQIQFLLFPSLFLQMFPFELF